jgi:hypothetical protein
MITKPKVQKIRVRKWLEPIGGGTQTFNRLENLPQKIAEEMSSRAALQSDEEALLANFRSEGEWCLLTTRRLVWLQDGALQTFFWNEIVGAQQPPEQSARLIRKELAQDQIVDLEVFAATGQKHVLRLGSGSPYFVVWSAILEFCNYTRRPDPIPL